MPRYNIYYHKYHVFAQTHLPYVKIAETDDIYHEIGKLICDAFEEIKDIHYTEAQTTLEEHYKLLARNGYRPIGYNTWIMDSHFFDEAQIEIPTEPIPVEPKKVMGMLCRTTRQMREHEGRCDRWIQSLLNASDEEYQSICNYLPLSKGGESSERKA